MDYQEAIKRHIEECKHRIDVINNFMKTNGDADKDKCIENIEIFKTAISAMQELEEYKELGTLEELREAVERQQAIKPHTNKSYYKCPNCGEIRSIRQKHDYCHDCGQKLEWK